MAAQILRGFFPELHSHPEIEAYEYYRSYVMTYLERDVKDLLNVSNSRDFERFIRACAIRTAQVLNKSDLARDIGISSTTINEWLSVLSASNQIHLLEAWFSNKSKSIIKTPKLYFYDTGLLCFLLNIKTETELLNSPFLGAIWESFVFSELIKSLVLTDEKESFYFWRDRKKEVDFMIQRAGFFTLIEAKFNSMPSLRDAQQMLDLAEFMGPKKIKNMSLVSSTAHSFDLEKNVRVRSIDEIFL